MFNRTSYIITNKDDLTNENPSIKQVLKENGYQQSVMCKIFNRIANSHSPSQSEQLMQATDIKEVEIRISIKLPYVEVTSEKLLHILRSHKIRSTFYTKCTLCKLPCKPKDWVDTEVDFGNSKTIYFDQSKLSLKLHSDEHKRSVRNYDCEKNKIVQNWWEEDNITTLAEIRRKLLIQKAG